MANLLQFKINARKSHQPQYTWLLLSKIRFKQLYLSNHSELITGTYEHSFFTTTNTVTSHSIELHNRPPYIYVHCRKKYSTKNSSALSVFIIHVSVAISYHSSHNVIFTFVMNITRMYLQNYVNHPNFSVLSAYKKSIKIKLSFLCRSHEEI